MIKIITLTNHSAGKFLAISVLYLNNLRILSDHLKARLIFLKMEVKKAEKPMPPSNNKIFSTNS